MTIKTKLNLLEQCGFGPNVMKRTKVCPHCGELLSQNRKVCPECGMRLLGKTLYDRYQEHHLCCDKCKTVLASDSCFCPHCGRPLYLKKSQASPISQAEQK